ncbi:hypothetical protein [Runella rosea]|uniref:hypothetical protein n=1 Tax=Runella rosea TaxID=2259595 RepID=UPI0013B3B38B|nr:hypothetical protein [Runella rosea]
MKISNLTTTESLVNRAFETTGRSLRVRHQTRIQGELQAGPPIPLRENYTYPE